jgi:hypothetical protein
MTSSNSAISSNEQAPSGDRRAEWERPVLYRLAVHEAQGGSGQQRQGSQDHRS